MYTVQQSNLPIHSAGVCRHRCICCYCNGSMLHRMLVVSMLCSVVPAPTFHHVCKGEADEKHLSHWVAC
jgi:hypothetical protein